MKGARTPSKRAREDGSELARQFLVQGRILIGETVTVDIILRNIAPPRRRTLRGLIYDIRDDAAYMCVLGQRDTIVLPLEPVAPDPAGVG